MLGVDLSGPTNTADTAAAWFRTTRRGLVLEDRACGLGDGELVARARELAARGPLVVGLDAPLSYQPGGGSRVADTELRRRLVACGLPAGTVMAPTMTRMAFLTLRGLGVARALGLAAPEARLVEVHPGGALALRGAPVGALRRMKRDGRARLELLRWLAARGLEGLPREPGSDHEVAAFGCALGAWQWSQGHAAWSVPAEPPLHPFDFAC